jgi:hypothetical protein
VTEPAGTRSATPASPSPDDRDGGADGPRPAPDDGQSRLVDRVADFVEDAVGAVTAGATEVARSAVDRYQERPGVRARRLRRRGRRPLANLYQVHPEARSAAPRELGLRTVDVDRIHGTAVGGPVQRGSDFLPLRPFRSRNWESRWQRLRQANDRLVALPPIDVVRFGDDYWVVDGHNRVASALYNGQVGIDANVVELVPPGRGPSERPGNLAAALTGSRSIRTAGKGRKVATIDDDLDPTGGPG